MPELAWEAVKEALDDARLGPEDVQGFVVGNVGGWSSEALPAVVVGSAEEFVEGMQRGRLMYTQCKMCGGKYFPPQVDCPRCKTSDVERREVSVEGELITWTVINVKSAGFSQHGD